MTLLEILTGAGNALDLPGSSVRDLLRGENPFDQWADPFGSSKRTSGRQLLESLGLLGTDDDSFGWDDVGGMGAEMLLDPINLLGGAGIARRLVKSRRTPVPPLTVIREGDEFGSRAIARIGEQDVGIVDLMLPGVSETQGSRRMFPELIGESDTVARIHGSDLHPGLHGRGIGQQMYVDAMSENPAAWFYNSGNSEEATRAIEALNRKGLIDLHWDRHPGGPRVMRLTPDGKAIAGTGSLIRDGKIPRELSGRDPVRLADILLGLGAHNTLARFP